MDSKTLIKRTTQFAHRAVKLALVLPDHTFGRHISSQLIRCSTSVAANYRAAVVAQSRASFKAKLSIVLEEADEAQFWIEFPVEERLEKKSKIEALLTEIGELKAIFFAARKTMSTKKAES